MGKLSGHTGNIMTMAIPKGETTSVVTGGKDHFIKASVIYFAACTDPVEPL